MFSFVVGLYGTRIRPVAPFGSLSSNPPVDLSLIHQALPDELLFEVHTDIDTSMSPLVTGSYLNYSS